jgi:hypothetical protein
MSKVCFLERAREKRQGSEKSDVLMEKSPAHAFINFGKGEANKPLERGAAPTAIPADVSERRWDGDTLVTPATPRAGEIARKSYFTGAPDTIRTCDSGHGCFPLW